MKKLLVCLYIPIIAGYVFPVFSQSQQMERDINNARDLMRYWHYRYRLLGDDEIPLLYPGFLQSGEGAGFSIPAEIRDRCKDDGWWEYQNGQDCENQNVAGPPADTGLLYWADATCYLGYYIAVLATEWELLHRQSQNTAGTELELYNALLALERLDNAGEVLYGFPAVLNGFILRDDVPMAFHQQFSADYELVSSGGSCSDPQTACFPSPKCDVTDYAPSLIPCFPYGNAPSIDQYIRILFGMRFVTKFIPVSVQVNSISLNVMAKNIAIRLLDHLKNGAATCMAQGLLSMLTTGNSNATFNTSWTLLDPNCELVCRGPWGQFFSYAFAESGKKITGDGFHDVFSISAGLAIWNIIKAEAYLTPNGTIDLCVLPPPPIPLMFTLMLSTGSICYGHDFDLSYNMNMILLLAVTSDTWNKNTLGETAYNTNKTIYDLAGAVLNEYDPTMPTDPQGYWENLLSKAPCNGPCFDTYPTSECHCIESSNIEWRYTYRWDKFQIGVAGEYSGLDYMLAFNLYRLAFWDDISWPSYIDITDRVIDVDFPVTITQPPFLSNPNAPAQVLGNDDYPLRVSAVSTMTVNSTVSPAGNVKFLAAKDVDVTSESDFQDGSETDVQVGFFDCEPNFFDLGGGSYIVGFKTSSPETQGNSPAKGDSLKYPISQYERTKAALEKEMFTLIPNPSTGKFTITAPLKENETVMLVIENSLGRTVYKSSISRNRTLIDLRGFPKGMYMVKLAKEERLFVKKFVLE